MISQKDILLLLSSARVIERLAPLSKPAILEILNSRDQPAFEQSWLAAYHLLSASQSELQPMQAELSSQIREAAYLAALRRFDCPEFAAAISDDFGMLADAAALGTEDPFLEHLFSKYEAGSVPS